MSRKRWLRLAAAALAVAGVAGLAAIAAQVPAGASHSAVDPGSMPRGPDPRVPYLRHDSIHDGSLSVPAGGGEHSQLWQLDRGYLVLDGGGRLTWFGRAGERQVIGWSVYTVAVSASRDRVVWGSARGQGLGPPVRMTVADVRTGALVTRRTFSRLLWTVAMTRHRVLLTTSWAAPEPSTAWWRLGRRHLWDVGGQAALGASVGAGRVMFAVGDPAAFCNRIAVLDRPAHTLWRSCRFLPRAWSPDGRRALATHTYFDDTGTDYRTVVDASTGMPTAKVTGRLDWNPAWEDAHHFLVSAMGDDGRAGVVRCDLHARCERATRLWDTGWSGSPPFYVAPPILLARN